ncbi:DUF4861 family protein [Sphingomonas sp. AOB5]|uniref:DUF4861 family protein n=1 Tax=Sphingomonas sp. AOB5 TaxID=3034017 RepID=UPI0023F92C84|nr:DUF4861 family protein [Sphingomonas sp. AOB5]MDF7774937.1 DUF4861 family protein [Sphingomonas sp. AOB5]
MRRALLLAPLLLLAAQDAPEPVAQATLNVRQADGSYKLVERIDVPADHKIHDGLIAFEGPGWESDRVAYRLYLDERNVPDIYGKKLPAPILPRIGMGKDDYHTMADWGMDLFQVNKTLGMGGIGVMREGKVTQLGPSTIRAQVFNKTDRASVAVINDGFSGNGGRPARLMTNYSIRPGSRVTEVMAMVLKDAPPMVAGLTVHPGVEKLASNGPGWRYIATWGKQSLAGDELGIALFYPAANVAETGENSGTYFVRFCNALLIRYAFAAAWVQEPGAPKDIASFRTWLEATAAELGENDKVSASLGCKN